MSLVSLNEILVPARKEKYGVGAYDYVNLEMLQGILDAAEETKTPVILQFPHIEEEAFWAEIEAVTAMTLELAKKARFRYVYIWITDEQWKLVKNVQTLASPVS